MRYFMLEGAFNEDHAYSNDERRTYINAHLEYLALFYQEGTILFSGGKPDGSGGIIIVRGNDLSDIEEFCEGDPLKQSGIQEYRIIEFSAYNCQDEVRAWFDRPIR